MKRNIEINDPLGELITMVQDELKDSFLEYLKENEPHRCPDMLDLDHNGTVHEIVDSTVPIYAADIRDVWYLHEDRLIEAYENAGVGDNPKENDGMAAIYFLLMDKANEWFDNEAEEIFEEWEVAQTAKDDAVFRENDLT